jgi:hypothetical protein
MISKGFQTSYTEITEEKDFFNWSDSVDLIITNPPFSLAQEFINHSLKHASCTILLLRVNFLASIKRYEWWKQIPPTALHILSKRPSFTGSGTDATDYAWFVWDKTGKLDRGIRFVKPPTTAQTVRDNASCKQALQK